MSNPVVRINPRYYPFNLCGNEKNQVKSLAQELVRNILDKVESGQTLRSAIESTDTGFGSAAMRLQQYFAQDFGAYHRAPDLCQVLSRAEYDEMVRSHDEEISVRMITHNSVIEGICITYRVICHVEHDFRKECHTGICEMEVPRFKKISRLQNRKST